MKSNYKPRYAHCKYGEHDNPVEVGQAMSPYEMLMAYTRGQSLPEKRGEYDEGITIDEVGYYCPDRLDAIDYLNSVNQRVALAKANKAKAEAVTETKTETPVSNE